jgi:hypothetical protein
MTFSVQTPLAARAAAGLPGAADIGMGDLAQARYHLGLLHKEGQFLELRAKVGNGMQSAFFQDHYEAAEAAIRVSEKADVYVGVLPRTRHEGGKDALLPGGHWMWAECDTEAAVNRALNMPLPPQFVVQSSPGKAHCYWALFGVTRWEHIEVGNRRLAWHIGADLRACDAARILRVAGTKNYKRGEPQPVRIVRMAIESNVWPGQLVGDLPDPAPPKPMLVQRSPLPPGADTEALKAIPARVYIPALTGAEVLRGMACCPFHEDRSPSLSVQGPNDELWFCFGGCGGGDVFSAAARVWGLDVRTDFKDIKRRLKEIL